MSYKHIRSLARGVAVLRHLNAVESATAAAIAESAQLPRPTVYRILDTLVEQGLIYRSPSSNNVYRLTGHVRELSDGCPDEWIASAALPAVESLTVDTGQPAYFATLEDEEMVIRASLRASGPIGDRNSLVGQRRSLLFSAPGRTYLAFCPSDERANILARLRQRSEPEAELSELTSMQAELATARRDGYVVRQKAALGEIAVPVVQNGRLLGCIGLEWNSVPAGDVTASDLAPALQRARSRAQAALPPVLS